MSEIGPDVPLRLADALKLAYPAGGMTLSGLRREIKRGTLDVEIVANKSFVTLRAIEQMRERCRRKARVHVSGYDLSEEEMTESSSPMRSTSFLTAENRNPQAVLEMRLKKRSNS